MRRPESFLKRLFLRAYGFLIRVKVINNEEVQQARSAILLIPHTGGSDAIILETALRRRIFYFAQRRFFSSPLANWFFERLGDCLPISFSFNPANIVSLRRGLRLVENGETLGIFLEMNKDNGRHFQAPLDIAAYLSLRSNSPIFPVTIANIHQRPSRFAFFNHAALGETIYTLIKNLFWEVTITIYKPIYLKASHFSKSRNKLRSKLAQSVTGPTPEVQMKESRFSVRS